MVFINSEGKCNENWFLIDAQMFGMKGNAAIYIVENDGERMMIDTTTPALIIRKIIKKLRELGLFPIHRLLLSHSHWDHIEGVGKLKAIMKGNEMEILASKNAIENLKHPEKMNKEYEAHIEPIEEVTSLKEGDIINLNGLELEVFDFFGHTQDLIAIFDRQNKNIYAGDAVINKYDTETFLPVFLSHEFNEYELHKTFTKLRNMKDDLTSICLSHFGVWTDHEFYNILETMENIHSNTKDAIIQWYSENDSLDYIASKYHETFISNSSYFRKENLMGLKLAMQWLVEGLKISGFI